ncbi:hypothetical protein CVT24_001236 [Panaeolus cyanescens]|uniref:Uncharacterized protein n=1 Tax=Panaeolus cyanescens TaxID=181874 RepID=A0A409YYY9_9AGAR|nr:hypothetical protein CVT24_001236 [Panaeolus cyanescens]
MPALEGGYEAFVEKKKSGGSVSSLKRKSLQLSKTLTSSMGGYLPNSITEMWEPTRDFAYLRLPGGGGRTVVGMSGTMPHVMVISSDGYFYSYSIDLEKGGECSLLKQYSLLDSSDELVGLEQRGQLSRYSQGKGAIARKRESKAEKPGYRNES